MQADVMTDAYLDEIRRIGDPEVDELVSRTLGAGGAPGATTGRLNYNDMLDLADRLVATPSLMLVPASVLNQQMQRIPEPLRDYFSPMEAPPWVDPAKLVQGGLVWQHNMLALLGVLYAYSLPACYLVAKGIPALYQTAKLREPRFLFQRVYETGVMLSAVMGENGLRVVHDLAEGSDDPDQPREVKRYLWGDGYLAAKKVRFLHASMRYMLLNPAGSRPDPTAGQPETLAQSMSIDSDAWDTARLGAPINQEDLAYTLLTFGYALPKGLAHWGCRVDDEQRHAFLHLWRTVGHVMGIRDELMTDDWDEAARLFDFVKHRQGHSSPDGLALTESLLGFLAEYLPAQTHLSHRIAALMMMDQMGKADAEKILEPDLVRDARRLDRRALYALGIMGVRLYYQVRTLVFDRLPAIAALFGNLLERSAHELVESWRGAYARRPFYVPANSTTWKLKAGATEKFRARLVTWRRKLFKNLAVSIGLLFVSAFSFVAMLPMWLLGESDAWHWAGWACLASLVAAGVIMKWRLPAIHRERPVIARAPEATP